MFPTQPDRATLAERVEVVKVLGLVVLTIGTVEKEAWMIRVIEVEQINDLCPSLWQGKTDDGRFVFARTRWERLTVSIGTTPQDAVGGEIVLSRILDVDLDGDAGTERLKDVTAEVILWPDYVKRPTAARC